MKTWKKLVALAALTVFAASSVSSGQLFAVDGDTLYSISQQYNLRPEELKRLNGLDSNIISLGQKLRVR